MNSTEIDHGPFSHLRKKKLKSKDYTVEMKLWLGNQIIEKKASYAELNSRYGANKNTIKTYAQMVRKGVVPQLKRGNHHRVADSELDSLKSATAFAKNKFESVKGDQKVTNSRLDETMQRLLHTAAVNTEKSRGYAPVAAPLSTSTKYRLKKRMKVKTTFKAQQKTKARTREMQDHRNFFVEACILEGYARNLSAHCELNLDATQLAMGKVEINYKLYILFFQYITLFILGWYCSESLVQCRYQGVHHS